MQYITYVCSCCTSSFHPCDFVRHFPVRHFPVLHIPVLQIQLSLQIVQFCVSSHTVVLRRYDNRVFVIVAFRRIVGFVVVGFYRRRGRGRLSWEFVADRRPLQTHAGVKADCVTCYSPVIGTSQRDLVIPPRRHFPLFRTT